MPLQKVRRSSVSSDVFDQLVQEVLSGGFSPGEALPGERTLTEALGVNRQAVREALQRLAEAGLVDIRHGGRTRVTDYRRAAGLELLPRLLVNAAGVDADVAASIMELRTCLGPDIARRCAQRADQASRHGVADAVAQMEAAADDLDELAELDLQMWEHLVDGSGNVAYRLAFNQLRRTYEPVSDVLRETLRAELTDHKNRRDLAAAVASGDDEGAAAAARRLLSQGEDAVRNVFGETNDGGDPR